jgi:hypothetical protein
MKYVLTRYAEDGPSKLITIRDTHVRSKGPIGNREKYYSELQEAFRKFLEAKDADDLSETKCQLIFGWDQDDRYVKMVQTAAAGLGDKVGEKLECRRFHTPGPMMNFILMGYGDGTFEVLFGWGQGRSGIGVIASNNPTLIGVFENFFNVLYHASDLVTLESLSQKPRPLTPT